MAVTAGVSTIVDSHELKRTPAHYPQKSPMEDSFFVRGKFVQAAEGEPDSTVVLFQFPKGKHRVNFFNLFHSAFGTDGQFSIVLGEHTVLESGVVEEKALGEVILIEAHDAVAATFTDNEFSIDSLEGVDLVLLVEDAGTAGVIPAETEVAFHMLYTSENNLRSSNIPV